MLTFTTKPCLSPPQQIYPPQPCLPQSLDSPLSLTPCLPTCAFCTAWAPTVADPEIAQVHLVVTTVHPTRFACFADLSRPNTVPGVTAGLILQADLDPCQGGAQSFSDHCPPAGCMHHTMETPPEAPGSGEQEYCIVGNYWTSS